ncbi:zinc ribbon domain-containing protein [Dictyobacter kobayashii]|uniref:Zinc-ribbon domain-containing protein n=1 Tax=Dictyobacter kobayashii TaxID=2014872 RepID=A0A402AKN7_9CHLR|nr:zinc ribbon domain-containing protein [Dictyobacter kobayashii]GCE19687.1 hypothetical protein KDK_34870 [Dictyobacter kobayashii]
MKCQQCQAQLSPQARFCPHCGTPVQTQEPLGKEEIASVEQAQPEVEHEPEPDNPPESATVRVSPYARRIARSWRKAQGVGIPPVRSKPIVVTSPLANDGPAEAATAAQKDEPAADKPVAQLAEAPTPAPASTNEQEDKLTIPEQPPTVVELNALHLYASVPLPYAPIAPEHHTEELPTQPISISSITHPELFETAEQQQVKPQDRLSPLQQSLRYYIIG